MRSLTASAYPFTTTLPHLCCVLSLERLPTADSLSQTHYTTTRPFTCVRDYHHHRRPHHHRQSTHYLLALLPPLSLLHSARLASVASSRLHLISSRLASPRTASDSHPSRDEFRSAARLATRPTPRSRQLLPQPASLRLISHTTIHPFIHPSLPQPATELHCWRRPLLSPTLNLCATAALSRTSRTPLPARRYISSHKTQRLRVPLSPLTRPPTTHHLAVAQSQSQHRPHCHCHLPHLITHLPSTPFILRSRGAPVPRLPPKA